MEKINLTKREYLGEGYNFQFKNNKTEKVINVPCSKEEYEVMINPETENPTKDGFTFLGGNGGFILVDSEKGTLSPNEVTIIEDEYIVCVEDSFFGNKLLRMSQEEFNSKYIWQ